MTNAPAAAVWPTLLVVSLAWGTTLLWVKLAGATLAPFQLTFWRGVAAFLALGLFIAWRGQRPRIRLRDVLVLGTTNGWLSSALMAFALGRIDTAPAALVAASMPLILSVFSHLCIPGERMTVPGVIGVGLGFLGIALVLGPGVLASSSGSALGFLAMLAVATGYATGTTYGRLTRPPDPAGTAFGQQVLSIVVSAALALATGQGIAPPTSPVAIGAIAALGTVATAVPMVLYWRLLGRAPASVAGFVDYLIPLWATALAVTVLGETLQPTALAGGALVLAGIAIATRRAKPVQVKPEGG